MSELKVYIHPIKKSMTGNTIVGTAFYYKSEVDKVISELEEKHKTEVKELLYLISDKENNFNRAFDSEEKEIRHQKYKRCLRNAEGCLYKIWYYNEIRERKKASVMWKWRYRWLELEKEFKREYKNGRR